MPTIKKPNSHFDATIWTGNGSTQTITNSGAMQPDFVWVKQRNSTAWHSLVDSVRGVTKYLYSNATDAEGTQTTLLTSFNSNGFSLSSDSNVNGNASTYVGWQWKAGGASTVNTSGSISSNVSVNTTAGFSIVTYTGNGTGGATVGHGLGVAPKMFIVKNRVQGTYGNWNVWHTALSGSQYLTLNATDAAGTNNNRWNGTVPTSTVFSLGADTFGNTNKSGDTYVAYCWAEIAGFSKFGSYTGNGSTDGPFVYTGFRPKFLMFKTTTIIGHWVIVDTARNTYNVIDNSLYPDTSGSEINSITDVDFLSNGFKWRGVLANETNVNGEVYIYAAFAEAPFKYANAK